MLQYLAIYGSISTSSFEFRVAGVDRRIYVYLEIGEHANGSGMAKEHIVQPGGRSGARSEVTQVVFPASIFSLDHDHIF